jgi:DnaJ-class molecular chaperone
MADQGSDNNQAAEPSPCTACRGTGKVISGLGGTNTVIDCPWCEGSGVFIPGHDAQAHWRKDEDAADVTAE